MTFIKVCERFEQFKYTVYLKGYHCVLKKLWKVWTNFKNFIENFGNS